MHYYNRQRLHQALNGKTPVEEILSQTVPSNEKHNMESC